MGSPTGFVAQLTDGTTSPGGRQPPLRAVGGADTPEAKQWQLPLQRGQVVLCLE